MVREDVGLGGSDSARDRVEIRQPTDGTLLWSSTATSGRKIVVGHISSAADSEFVVMGADGSLNAFSGGASPTLLWRKADINAADFSLGDRNGDGVLEIAVATTDSKLLWLGGNGAQIGNAVTSTYPYARVAVAKVDAAPARVVAVEDNYTGGTVSVRSLDLASEVAHTAGTIGPFDSIAIGDLQGDGTEDLVSIAGIPWGYNPSVWTNSSRLTIYDLATHALVWSSAIPTGQIPDFSDRMLDLAIGRVQPGTNRQIVVLGIDMNSTYEPVLDIIDGTTHALLRRTPVQIGDGRTPTHVRLVDVDGDGIAEIVLVSGPANSVTTGVRVHVLKADTLNEIWTSPVLTSEWPASSVATRPSGGTGADHLILTVAQAGFWSIDLAGHLIDYSVPADAPSAALVADVTPTGRVAIIDRAQPAVVIVDAANGTEIDRLSLLDSGYSGIVALPPDASRIALSADDHVESWNLATHQHEGTSPLLASLLAHNGTLLARANGDGGVVYAGNSVGIWSLPTISFQQLIFANGFEP